MSVNPTDTRIPPPVRVDTVEHDRVGRLPDLRQAPQERKRAVSLRQAATGQFSDNHRMSSNLVGFEQFDQIPVGPPKVVDPHGGVDKRHGRAFTRRLGIILSFGAEPPIFASIRALSWATSMRRPR